MESWKGRAKAEASSSAAVFRMYAGISSGHMALCTLKFFSSLWTPFQSNQMFCIVGDVTFTCIMDNIKIFTPELGLELLIQNVGSGFGVTLEKSNLFI